MRASSYETNHVLHASLRVRGSGSRTPRATPPSFPDQPRMRALRRPRHPSTGRARSRRLRASQGVSALGRRARTTEISRRTPSGPCFPNIDTSGTKASCCCGVPSGRSGARPPRQHLARPFEPTPVNQLRERRRRRLRPPPHKAAEAGQHGVRLLEPDVRHLGAVTGVPAERRPPKPAGIVNQEQDELESLSPAPRSRSVSRGRGGSERRASLARSRTDVRALSADVQAWSSKC
jgi:hypothetical protein